MQKAFGILGALFLTVMLCAGSVIAAEQVFFYHTDPAGTPLAMTDSTGKVVWKSDNKPFGEEYAVTGTITNNKRFIGKEKDEETGLSNIGVRYQDAKTGRFTSPDPVRAVDPTTSQTNEKLLLNPQRLNVYSYALNNPYRYIDPDGRDAWDIGFFAYSAYNFVREPTRENAVYLGLDTVGLIPVVPALGTIARVGKGAEHALEARKLAEPIYKTTKEAKAAAEALGFKKIKDTVHDGQAVFTDGKTYITRDLDGHNGGAWKRADSVENLGSKETRIGTFDVNLKRIGN